MLSKDTFKCVADVIKHVVRVCILQMSVFSNAEFENRILVYNYSKKQSTKVIVTGGTVECGVLFDREKLDTFLFSYQSLVIF